MKLPLLYPSQDELRDILHRFDGASVGVLGDFCVDAYWFIDPERVEWSIETGKRVQHVLRQRYTPGAAGNVVANLCALGVRRVETFGVIGADLFGQETIRLFRALDVAVDGLIVQASDWDTPVYGKPYFGGEELQRMDFGAFNSLSQETWARLLERVRAARRRLDFLIVNQQLPHGWCNPARAAELAEELQQWGGCHLVDARQYAAAFPRACHKVNEREAARMAGRELPDDAKLSDEEVTELASRSSFSDGARNGLPEPQFITRGERGIAAGISDNVTLVPGVMVLGPTDPVGAGDAVTATLAACLASGTEPDRAGVLANLAASITVQKINQTGTASRDELLEAARDLAYVFNPALADEPRRAVYVEGAAIEIVETPPAAGSIRFAVFDHDGTISTLRQGWEQVMEPVMMRAILGQQYRTADSATFQRVQARVRHFIEQSTGIQTILQMDGLVNLVAEFGIVPEPQRLDAFGYKAVYNAALMEMVDARLAQLQRGELERADFIMKGAVEFARALREKGLILFLVSGTDEADVAHEAEALGYADLFDGGIHGAKPGSRADSKEGVILDILENRIGPAAQGGYLVVGDGPVEMRLARRYGGCALGVASSEERRFGWNEAKRRRVIRGGAHLVVPDFAQWRAVVAYST